MDIPLELSTIDEVNKTHKELVVQFERDITKDVKYRKRQLVQLLKGIKQFEQPLFEAFEKDLAKPSEEVRMVETGVVYDEIDVALKSVDSWASLQSHPLFNPLMRPLMSSYLRCEPLGVVLIMGPFNYPITCTFTPFVAAIAAGNCVCLKVSEKTPHVSAVMRAIVHNFLDTESYRVVLGESDIAKHLTSLKWDKVMFTGSMDVGKVISKSVSEHMTPLALELGGKNPCFVTPQADLEIAAKRIVFGKAVNCGQTCIAPDYIVLTSPELLEPFVAAIKAAFTEQYPGDAFKARRLVNRQQAEHVIGMLKKTKGKVRFGGNFDMSNLYVDFTVVTDVKLDDSLMQKEIFGPVLPILCSRNHDDSIDLALSIWRTPLSLYYFGATDQAWKVFDRIASGSAVMNDCVVQAAFSSVPFGGIGSSGNQTYYHSRYGFLNFSHQRTIAATKTGLLARVFDVFRYPPITKKKAVMFDILMNEDPDSLKNKIFNRRNFAGLISCVIVVALATMLPKKL